MSQQYWSSRQTSGKDSGDEATVYNTDEEYIRENHALYDRNAGFPAFRPPDSVLKQAPLSFAIESAVLLVINIRAILPRGQRCARDTIFKQSAC